MSNNDRTSGKPLDIESVPFLNSAPRRKSPSSGRDSPSQIDTDNASIDVEGNQTQAMQGKGHASTSAPAPGAVITATGLKVLVLLAVQNSSKNLLMRYVMKDQPKFLTSAAVIGSECCKLTLSLAYILLYERKAATTILQFFKDNARTTKLVIVPASSYNLQMTLEYIALANIDAATFSVLVQLKLLCTATFAAIVLQKKLRYIQVLSLLLLTVGVMLCNLKVSAPADDAVPTDPQVSPVKGILATLGITISSGFASVYTEKVIKGAQSSQTPPTPPTTGDQPQQRTAASSTPTYGLAYTQVQLASMSLLTIGLYACIIDASEIWNYGLFHNFTGAAYCTILNSAIGGLIVAAVLKHADSVLKGYATAVSVVLTGTLSTILFGTRMQITYALGIVNVVVAVLLYNGKNFDRTVC